MANTAAAVTVRDVRKRWIRRSLFRRDAAPPADVFSNVTFAVAAGEIVAVLGENGSGKTTLLKIIAGLARPDAGDVRLLGENGIDPPPSLRRRVAYSGGERGFYFRLTARENLAFYGALDGLSPRKRAERIASVASIVDIEGDLDRRFADLSSGTRQRLAIGRALIADPEVLLLDEPTRALDPRHASELRTFVRDVLSRRLGKTIIVATNLIEEALELGDRIALLRSNLLEFVATSSDGSRERAIRDLFGAAPRA